MEEETPEARPARDQVHPPSDSEDPAYCAARGRLQQDHDQRRDAHRQASQVVLCGHDGGERRSGHKMYASKVNKSCAVSRAFSVLTGGNKATHN